MNLFILSMNPQECAQWMMDVHIVKIILEAVQMLSTAKRLLSINTIQSISNISKTKKQMEEEKREKKRLANELDLPVYRVAHMNHPVCIWVRQSRSHYVWTLDLVEAMHNEWRYRYGHGPDVFHKSYRVAQYLRENPPPFQEEVMYPFALAMPDEYKVVDETKEGRYDVIESYRNYYRSPMKQALASWRKRTAPDWFFE
jgi:hypothetical protein